MARLLLLLLLSTSVSSCFLEYWGCGSEEKLQRYQTGDQPVRLEDPMQVGESASLVVSSATCDAYGFAEVHRATIEPDIADWHIRQENGFPEIVLEPHTAGEARLTVTYQWGEGSRELSTDIVVVDATEE